MNRLKWLRSTTVTSNLKEKNSDIAIVTFANISYLNIVSDLKISVEKFCKNTDLFIFTEFSQINCPPHSTHPYAFKPYAIEKVKDLGYKIVIWIDSSIRAVKDVSGLIPEIESKGVFLQLDGWATGQWANDNSLDYFGITRDYAMNIPAIYACIMAFDFKNPLSSIFLQKWKKSADDGIFLGKWKNDQNTESKDSRCSGHRHDQTCAEIISHQLSIPRGYLIVAPNDPSNEKRYFTSWNHS